VWTTSRSAVLMLDEIELQKRMNVVAPGVGADGTTTRSGQVSWLTFHGERDILPPIGARDNLLPARWLDA